MTDKHSPKSDSQSDKQAEQADKHSPSCPVDHEVLLYLVETHSVESLTAALCLKLQREGKEAEAKIVLALVLPSLATERAEVESRTRKPPKAP